MSHPLHHVIKLISIDILLWTKFPWTKIPHWGKVIVALYSALLCYSCSFSPPNLSPVWSVMSSEEVALRSSEVRSDKLTGIKTRLLNRIPTRQRLRLDQRMREMVGLSVAVVLGFNIGDGNIRDRLQGRDGSLFLTTTRVGQNYKI